MMFYFPTRTQAFKHPILDRHFTARKPAHTDSPGRPSSLDTQTDEEWTVYYLQRLALRMQGAATLWLPHLCSGSANDFVWNTFDRPPHSLNPNAGVPRHCGSRTRVRVQRMGVFPEFYIFSPGGEKYIAFSKQNQFKSTEYAQATTYGMKFQLLPFKAL